MNVRVVDMADLDVTEVFGWLDEPVVTWKPNELHDTVVELMVIQFTIEDLIEALS